MAKEGSVAPRERVNIVYKPATGDMQEEKELPLKLLMMGDYTQREDDRQLEDRKPINIDKDNFNEVMRNQDLGISTSVPNKLEEESEDELPIELKFGSLKDFEPEAVARQIPELTALLDLRQALTALKGPLGNIPAFRKTIQKIMGDEASRQQLMKELGVGSEGESSGE